MVMMGGKNWRDIVYGVQIRDIWWVGSTNPLSCIMVLFVLD